MENARILVVDDDPVSLKTIGGLLEADGYTLVTAARGREALAMIRSGPEVDLVLLDVVLPDLDGIKVCREIKAMEVHEPIPVILVSAFRKDDTSIREGLAAGADGYLLKPIEDTALRAWVRAALRIRALQRELAQEKSKPDMSVEDLLRTFAKLSHAVNNPLQTLYAAVDMLALRLPQTDEVKARLDAIMQHAERTARLVAEASLQANALLRRSEGPPGGAASS